MKQKRFNDAYLAGKQGVAILEKLIKFPKLKSKKA